MTLAITPLELWSVIRKRWPREAVPDIEAVLGDNPELLEDPVIVAELLYEQYVRRLLRGEDVSVEGYCAQYPEYASVFRVTVAVDSIAGVKAELKEEQRLQRQPPPDHWPAEGEQIGDLTLLRELGRGSFARVFLAREQNTGNRLMVVKLTHDSLHEAHTLGPLEHDNIVPVWSARPEPSLGLNVVCMPYLGEATLNDLLCRAFPRPGMRPPSSADIVRQVSQPPHGVKGQPALEDKRSYEEGIYQLLAQLADGLAFLHASDICHRDIKPSNVLIGFSGKALLLDFNLSADVRLVEKSVGGTLRYMAPEQLRAWGNATAPLPGPSADVFALGVIAYQLLTGHHPFGPSLQPGEVREMAVEMKERYTLEPLPLDELNPAADAKVGELIQRCLAVEPTLRPTAGELLTALRQRLAPRLRWRDWLRRPRVAVAAVLLLALTAFGTAQAVRRTTDVTADVTAEAQQAYQRGAELLHEKKHTQARDHFSRAQQLRADGRALARMAYCDALNGEHPRAFDLCNDALDKGYSSARLYNLRGYVLQQFGDYPRYRGKAQDAYKQADLDYTEAIRLEPGLQAAYYNRAMLRHGRAIKPLKDVQPAPPFEDMRQALKLGPVTPALAYDAARLFAFASKQTLELRKEALDWLEQSIQRGADPERLPREPLFEPLRPEARFQQLVQAKKVPGPARQELRVVDPVNDE